MLSWLYGLIHRTMHGTYCTEIRVETLNHYFNLLNTEEVLSSRKVFYPLRGQIKSVSLQLTVINPLALEMDI